MAHVAALLNLDLALVLQLVQEAAEILQWNLATESSQRAEFDGLPLRDECMDTALAYGETL